ncbi:hypothetical protein E1189_05485 [Sansalvadorimonas verongulae]|nr:hypothetical protein [Sansalvadorimonas verongulae]
MKSGENVTATDNYSWFDRGDMDREFTRNVQKKPAYEAVLNFVEETAHAPRSTILIGFPVSDDPQSKLDEIFQVILPRNPNMRIILIDADQPRCEIPKNVVFTDITERLGYTPYALVGDRVFEYRVNLQPTA